MNKLHFETTASGGLRPVGDIATASLGALRQAKADLTRWVGAIGDKTTAGTLTATDRENLTAVRTHLATVSSALADREAINEREREAAAAMNGQGGDADALASERARRVAGLTTDRGALDAGDGRRARPATSATFAGMFGAQAATMDGWDAPSEFARCVALGLHDGRLRIAAAMGSETGSGGGFAVPPAMFGQWLDQALESELVRPPAQIWPIVEGNSRKIPAWDVADRSSGLAGFAINWQPENPTSDATPQVGKLRELTLKARRGAIFAAASGELVEDGMDFDAQLSSIMSAALGVGLDQSFLWGLGSNEPQGIFTSGALITVTRDTTNQIIYDDLTEMFSRLSPASIPRSVWIAHSSTIPMLATLSVAVGTGGSHVPVMTQNDGRFYILTREVIFTEKCKPLGTLGDIALCDFSRYAIGLRRDAALDKSIHVGFLKNQQYFRLQIRLDGMPVDAAPSQPPNSAPTQSPFVTLSA